MSCQPLPGKISTQAQSLSGAQVGDGYFGGTAGSATATKIAVAHTSIASSSAAAGDTPPPPADVLQKQQVLSAGGGLASAACTMTHPVPTPAARGRGRSLAESSRGIAAAASSGDGEARLAEYMQLQQGVVWGRREAHRGFDTDEIRDRGSSHHHRETDDRQDNRRDSRAEGRTDEQRYDRERARHEGRDERARGYGHGSGLQDGQDQFRGSRSRGSGGSYDDRVGSDAGQDGSGGFSLADAIRDGTGRISSAAANQIPDAGGSYEAMQAPIPGSKMFVCAGCGLKLMATPPQVLQHKKICGQGPRDQVK